MQNLCQSNQFDLSLVIIVINHWFNVEIFDAQQFQNIEHRRHNAGYDNAVNRPYSFGLAPAGFVQIVDKHAIFINGMAYYRTDTPVVNKLVAII